ncbi:YitT family protein [Agreia sp. Leaf335]|uniref:YitT family protein n=1 Tax=Agreia sp. Leaf335 TaxID=1736340 RepID=UPI0009E84879
MTSSTLPTATPPVVRSVTQASPGHTMLEDVLAILMATITLSLGVLLLKTTGAVTGGTAGLSLLISYATALPFSALFLLVNVPFFALAFWKKGLAFTVRSIISVSLVSLLSSIVPSLVSFEHLNPVYGTLVGNLLAGVGMLILFRHGSSMGGFNVLALLTQEKLGWRAGYVQMGLDVAVVLAAFAVAPPWMVLLSALGAVVPNIVLAFNHRPGRYAPS